MSRMRQRKWKARMCRLSRSLRPNRHRSHSLHPRLNRRRSLHPHRSLNRHRSRLLRHNRSPLPHRKPLLRLRLPSRHFSRIPDRNPLNSLLLREEAFTGLFPTISDSRTRCRWIMIISSFRSYMRILLHLFVTISMPSWTEMYRRCPWRNFFHSQRTFSSQDRP